VSPAKTAEVIKIPFGLRTWVGPGMNYALHGVQNPDASWEEPVLRGGWGIPL